MGDIFRRIFAWAMLVLSVVFLLFSVLFFVECGKRDKMEYTAYFKVMRIDKTEDAVTFSFKNKFRPGKHLSYDLLLYGVLFNVDTKDSSNVEYLFSLGTPTNGEIGSEINLNVPKLSFEESYQLTVNYQEIYDFLQKNGVEGKIRSVEIKDVLFCLLEKVSHDVEGEHNYFYTPEPWDSYFNWRCEKIQEVDDWGKQWTDCTYYLSLKYLVSGAEYYSVNSIRLEATAVSGNVYKETLYPSDYKYKIDEDSGELKFWFKYVPPEEMLTDFEIVDVGFSIVWKGESNE